ncbi:hypothetical protein RDABS01_034539 [Bienertia sinuspersici]
MVVLASITMNSASAAPVGGALLHSQQQPPKPLLHLPNSRINFHSFSFSNLFSGGIAPSSFRTPAVAVADTNHDQRRWLALAAVVRNWLQNGVLLYECTLQMHQLKIWLMEHLKKICRIMISCPKVGLDVRLDHSGAGVGVGASPEIVENVLKRFENAGMVSYRFFEWAGKQRNYTHNVEAYHTMIGSLAKIRQFELMWDLVGTMRSKGMLSAETFCIIMRKYARMQKVDEALYTFNVMEKYGVSSNLAAFNGLLSALCKSKNVRKAQEIFDNRTEHLVPDSKTYSILIDGWGREPNLPKARETFRQMVHVGCNPDIVTYGIMVDILCKAGRVDEAYGMLKSMDANGCSPTSFIYSILVHTYGIENRIEDAINTFMEMVKNGVEADVAVYNALISAFCKVNKFKNVFRVLKEMDDKGIIPNARTCNIVLNGLIGQGQSDEAYRVF